MRVEGAITQDAKTKELRDKALAAIRSEARIGPRFKPADFDINRDGTATSVADLAITLPSPFVGGTST